MIYVVFICKASSPALDTSDIISIVAAFVSFFSVIVSLIIYKSSKRDNEKLRLNDSLISLLNIGMQYPFVEDTRFINKVKDDESSQKTIQYELYCIAWFNFIEQLHNFYSGNKKRIENFVEVKEVVIMHKAWWERNQDKNIEGYKSNKFHKFINDYLNE